MLWSLLIKIKNEDASSLSPVALLEVRAWAAAAVFIANILNSLPHLQLAGCLFRVCCQPISPRQLWVGMYLRNKKLWHFAFFPSFVFNCCLEENVHDYFYTNRIIIPFGIWFRISRSHFPLHSLIHKIRLVVLSIQSQIGISINPAVTHFLSVFYLEQLR